MAYPAYFNTPEGVVVFAPKPAELFPSLGKFGFQRSSTPAAVRADKPNE